MLRYLLAVVVSFLGLLVGSLLIFMASEEQKPGKKYFIFVQNMVFALISALLLFFYNLNIILVIMVPLIMFILMHYTKDGKRSYVLFPLIGVVFYLVFVDNLLLIILSLLTFIYGLVTAFLLIDVKNKKSVFRVVLVHAPFLVTALLPFLISYL